MAALKKVVVTDFVSDDVLLESQVLAGVADVTALDARCEQELFERIDDADAIMMYHGIAVTRATIDRLKQCRLIVRCGVGVDNIDHAYAATKGIPVANVPDYGTEDVADSAIGMMLALARGIQLLNSRLRAGQGAWTYTQAAPLQRIRGQVFGCIGLGRIGQAAALRASAFGMDVLFFDPYKPDGYDKSLGIRRAETLDELLRRSFAVSLHCPLTRETRHMINDSTLGRMPAGAYLINTARGDVVDTSALVAAIERGHLAGAGIDVLTQEPPHDSDPIIRAWRNPEHPAHHRLIINPHAAFYSVQGMTDMRTKGAEACRRALLGEPIRNLVNEPVR